MFEQYVKLFRLDWIEPWLVEALAITFGALIAVALVVKFIESTNGDQQ